MRQRKQISGEFSIFEWNFRFLGAFPVFQQNFRLWMEFLDYFRFFELIVRFLEFSIEFGVQNFSASENSVANSSFNQIWDVFAIDSSLISLELQPAVFFDGFPIFW